MKIADEIKNLEGEIWKPVVGYEGLYEVSNMGRVKSLPNVTNKKTRLMKLYTSKRYGYVTVQLSSKGITKGYFVHRLVMKAFTDYRVDGYDQFFQIDHINCDKTDNRLENLEVVSQYENNRRYHQKHTPNYKTRKVICLDDGEVYDSVKSAAESVGSHVLMGVVNVCKGVRSQYRNAHFAYYDDYINGTIPPYKGKYKKESCKALWFENKGVSENAN